MVCPEVEECPPVIECEECEVCSEPEICPEPVVCPEPIICPEPEICPEPCPEEFVSLISSDFCSTSRLNLTFIQELELFQEYMINKYSLAGAIEQSKGIISADVWKNKLRTDENEDEVKDSMKSALLPISTAT